MPWSDSPDYQPRIRVRDALGVIGLLLLFLITYELVPAPKHPPVAPAGHAR